MRSLRFKKDIITQWASLNTYDPVQTKDTFDTIFFLYDDTLVHYGKYTAWQDFAQFLPSIPYDALIYDLCCGTGLCGETLYKNGYTNIVGIDFSTKMLSMAESRMKYLNMPIYRTLICENLLDKPKFNEKSVLAICIGSMTYFQDYQSFITYIMNDVTDYYFLFTERTDRLTTEYTDFLSNNFDVVQISDPMPYLPGFSEYTNIQIKYILLRK